MRRRALAFGGVLGLAVAAGSGAASAAPANPVAAQEWALNTLQNGAIHSQFNARGSGVVVAVLDMGVDPDQPDLQGRLVSGVNLVDPSSPTGDYADTDSESHGTAVATVIAADPHNDADGNPDGMLGLADEAKIMPVKTGTAGASGSASLAAGILYAVDHGAQVISISQATTGPDPNVTSAIDTALAAGVVVVVGAGNDGETGDAPNTVATVPGAIDVSGIDESGEIYHPGHYGPDVDVAAPANSIEVGLIGGRYGQESGTSFATPWVSAEAALIIGLHASWTSGQVVADIIDNTLQASNGQSKTGQRIDDYVGYGVIDPVAALGASEPSSTANPLGGPAITSNPAQNVKKAADGAGAARASASAGAGGGTGAGAGTGGGTGGTGASGSTSAAGANKGSSKTPLIVGVAVGVVVLGGLAVLLISRRSRGRRGAGPGGPGGGPGGAGGGNGGYYARPPSQSGGQYGVPGQHGPYQQSPYPQGPYQPGPYQQGPYGQGPYEQGDPNPYAQQQPQQQQPGSYPPPPQGGGSGGGYGRQQRNPQNPYSGG